MTARPKGPQVSKLHLVGPSLEGRHGDAHDADLLGYRDRLSRDMAAQEEYPLLAMATVFVSALTEF